MKKLAFLFLILGITASLCCCNPAKGSNNSKGSERELVLANTDDADKLLQLFQSNNYQLNMLDNDVVTNVDAIINLQEENSKIINMIEENPDILTPEQQELYKQLREEYRNKTGY